MNLLEKWYRSVMRYNLNKRNRNRLYVDDSNPLTVISSNCVGGVILSELGLRFNTPTINLFFMPDSYLEFISNLKLYTGEQDITEVLPDSEFSYPRGIIGGKVLVHFMHYKTFKQACDKWNERCRRINYNNLVFLMVERDGVTYEQMKQFDDMDLPGKKILMTCNDYPDISCAYNFGKEYMDSRTGQMIDLCRYKGKINSERYLDDFDYVSFFNK